MRFPASAALVSLGLALTCLAATPAPSQNKSDAEHVARLVRQLGSDDFDERERASTALEAVGEPALEALRRASGDTDAEVQARAKALVGRIERRVESARAMTAKRVRLAYKETPLREALDDFQKKSGYTIRLDDPKGEVKDRTLTLDSGEVPFWQALGQFCDKAGLKEVEPAVAPVAPPPVGVGRRGPWRAFNPPAAGPNVVIRAGLAVAAPAGLAPATEQIVLADGKQDAAPTDASTAVRVRASPGTDPAPEGEWALGLRLSLEPRLQWQNVDRVTVVKAVDDQGQQLAPAADSDGATQGGAGVNQTATIHLKKGASPARTLAELSGTVAARILGELKPVITVDRVLDLKDGDRTFKGGDNGFIRIAEVSKTNDSVTITLELRPPDDVTPAGAGPAAAGVVNVINGVGGAVIFAPGMVGPQNVSGLSLLDDAGVPVRQTNTKIEFRQTVANGVVTASQLYVLTFQPDKDQKASKLVYSGRKSLDVDIPFTLKDVPLP